MKRADAREVEELLSKLEARRARAARHAFRY